MREVITHRIKKLTWVIRLLRMNKVKLKKKKNDIYPNLRKGEYKYLNGRRRDVRQVRKNSK